MKINKKVLVRALTAWGFDNQLKMLREECIELALSICKFKDRDSTQESWDKVIDEMADVSIMLEQMKTDPVLNTQIQIRVNFKMKRLELRLDIKDQLKQ